MELKCTVIGNSIKNHNRCVAVIDANKNIRRLVTNYSFMHGAIPEDWMYGIGLYSHIRLQEEPVHTPNGPQTENYLIRSRPIKERDATVEERNEIHKYLYSLGNDHDYMFGNTNPFLTEVEIGNINHSLEFICAENIDIYHVWQCKRKVNFTYNGEFYEKISMTDPNIPDGHLDKALLLVSIPESGWQKNPDSEPLYYKFVSAVMV